MTEQKTSAPWAFGMTREFDDATLAKDEHPSDGHMVRCALLGGVVTCRTLAPSVKHMVRANTPAEGPAGRALDKSISVAIDSEYLHMCALFCVA